MGGVKALSQATTPALDFPTTTRLPHIRRKQTPRSERTERGLLPCLGAV